MKTRPNRPPEKRAVGIWIRVSTENQALGDSPQHHEHRARSYAQVKGWEIREVYRLEAVSGRSVRHHPEAERMLADVRSGRIAALIFSKLARLARNTRELLDFADLFREHGADLVSLDEAIDTSTPAGRLFYTMIAAMAQWEREEIASRVAASVKVRAELGKPTGGEAPFGYRWVEKKLAPHPEEAPVRRLIYELYVEHRRKKTVARILNERGLRTRRGKPFSNTTIERLLKDPTAKGTHRLNYTRTVTRGGRRQVVLKPREDWVEIPVEPIVPTDLWEQANALLEGQRKKHRRRGRGTVHLFSGLALCECGQKMYVPSSTLRGTPKYVCSGCHRKIPTEDLEAVFTEQLRSFLLSPEQVLRLLEETDETIKEKERLLETLEAEQGRTAREIDRLFALYNREKLSADAFGRRHEPLEKRLRQLEDQIPAQRGEIDFLRIQYLSSDEVVAEARDLCLRFPELTFDEKRRIVENITERIVVGDKEVTIQLCALPVLPSREEVPKRERTITGSSAS